MCSWHVSYGAYTNLCFTFLYSKLHLKFFPQFKRKKNIECVFLSFSFDLSYLWYSCELKWKQVWVTKRKKVVSVKSILCRFILILLKFSTKKSALIKCVFKPVLSINYTNKKMTIFALKFFLLKFSIFRNCTELYTWNHTSSTPINVCFSYVQKNWIKSTRCIISVCGFNKWKKKQV